MANVFERGNVTPTALVGTLAIAMTVFGQAATTPAMASLMAAFPDAPAWQVTLVSTTLSLTIMLGSATFGALANKIKFKTIAIIGMAIYTIFGILPMWVHDNLAVVIAIRALCGFGIGLIMPLGASWFLRSVRDKSARGTFLGWTQAIGSAGSVVLTMLGGTLCAINWTYTFLAYLFVALGFVIMLIFFKEPPTVEEIIAAEGAEAASELQTQKTKRVALPATVWAIIILFFFNGLCQSPGLSLLAPLMGEAGCGGSAIAGILLSMFTAIAAVVTAFGGLYLKWFGKFTTGIFACLKAAGLLFIAFGNAPWMFAAGIIGLAVGGPLAFLVNYEVGLRTNAAGAAWAVSLLLIFNNLGSFFSSFWIGFLQGIAPSGALNFPVMISGIVFATVGILFMVVNCMNKKAWGKKAPERD